MSFLRKMNVLLLLSGVLVFSACDSESGNMGSPCAGDFDQRSMFTTVADQLIIPGYQDFAAKSTLLKEQAEAFLSDGSQANLEALRTAWKNAYLSYQVVAQYEFGPAEDHLLRSTVANFPANVEQIENNLNSGTYDLNAADVYYRGFPALDYLLYGIKADDASIIASFMEDSARGATQRTYLSEVVTQIEESALNVLDGWEGKGFRATFVENTGTAAGTSLSQLINGWNQTYEILKRDKIGIPSGVLTLGFTNPENVEAFYSGFSLDLAKASLDASATLYTNGLDDLVQFVDAEKNGESLDGLIKAQFQSAREALNAIDGPLSVAVETDDSDVSTAYNELTKQVVQIKTDLPSVICVAITYVDNPSDSD